MRRRPSTPRGPVDPERSRRARESQRRGKAEENKGRKLLLWLHAEVIKFGTTRRKGDYQGTMQTPGIPDQMFILPATQTRQPRMLWWESKAGSGRMSPDQRKFRESILRCEGGYHVVGDVAALITWLCHEHYLRPDQVPHYYTQKTEAS